MYIRFVSIYNCSWDQQQSIQAGCTAGQCRAGPIPATKSMGPQPRVTDEPPDSRCMSTASLPAQSSMKCNAKVKLCDPARIRCEGSSASITHCLPPLFAADPIQLPKSHRAAPPPQLGLNLTWTRCCPGTNLNPRPHQTAHTWSCFSSTTWAPRAPHCAAATTLTSFCLLLSSLKQKGEKKKEKKKQTKEPQARDALRLPTHICLYHLLFLLGFHPALLLSKLTSIPAPPALCFASTTPSS